MEQSLSTIEYASMLYDFYGSLLNESQEEVMKLYHEDNLSLSEIAEELGTSRQAVHYTLKKAEKALEKYEEKLGLIAKYHENLQKGEEIIKAVEQILNKKELDAESKQVLQNAIEIIAEITDYSQADAGADADAEERE